MLNSRAEYEWMAQAEESLWWYRTLHNLVANALATHPAGTAARVLDAGCGTGGLLQFLRRRGFRHLEGFDLSPWAIETCRLRGLQVWHDDLKSLRNVTGQWDALICADTLSYLTPPERTRAVQSLAERLSPGGLFIINLPAFACFGGRHDEAVGTVRRFHPDEVRATLRDAKLHLQEMRGWPLLLSPAILAARLADRAAARLGYRGARPESRTPTRWINECLATLTRWEVRFIPRSRFGSSIFSVARKNSGADPSRPDPADGCAAPCIGSGGLNGPGGGEVRTADSSGA